MSSAAPEWLQLWDETQQWYYYYSTLTGESTWDAPPVYVPYQPAVQDNEQTPNDETQQSVAVDPVSAPLRPKSKRNVKDTTHSSRVAAPLPWISSERAICLFSFQFRAHVMCCEAPALFLECFLKSTWFIVYAGLLVVGRCVFDIRRRGHVSAAVAIREAIVHAASALSCVLPPVLLSMYRRFSPSTDEWTLAPLSTVIGSVDPRRFRVVLCGNGSWAAPSSDEDVQDITEYRYPMDRFCGPFALLEAREVRVFP
jgi:hypothetical protein